VYPILGYMDERADVTEKAEEDLAKALAIVEAHLTLRTFLVGEKVTLADIVLACALFYPMKMVLDAEFREAFPHVVRWFMTVVNQAPFKAAMGEVPLCEKRLIAKGGVRKAGTAESKKAGKKEKKAAAPKKEKKPKHPLEMLPKSPMDLDEWKRTYSNSKTDFYAAMPWFWENLDKEGWSVWTCKYDYNDENTVAFMTSNLVGGFIQRSDAVRKYAFGTMAILNETAPFEIHGAWLFRGQDNKAMIECNPDAEYYTWTKVEAFTDEEKAKVADLWCAMETVGGKVLQDSKVFK
jgi:elongation factor 1-gamma